MSQFSPPESPELASPCVRNCCLDEQDVCLGCGRLLSEILVWREASRTDRETILELAAQRRAARSRWPGGR